MLHNIINKPKLISTRYATRYLKNKKGLRARQGVNRSSPAILKDLVDMYELIRTNDAVILSFAESLMKDAGILCMIADESMSILEGSLGLLPRRFLVEEQRVTEARYLLIEAGLDAELVG